MHTVHSPLSLCQSSWDTYYHNSTEGVKKHGVTRTGIDKDASSGLDVFDVEAACRNISGEHNGTFAVLELLEHLQGRGGSVKIETLGWRKTEEMSTCVNMNFDGSLSAVPNPIFAIKYSFET